MDLTYWLIGLMSSSGWRRVLKRSHALIEQAGGEVADGWDRTVGGEDPEAPINALWKEIHRFSDVCLDVRRDINTTLSTGIHSIEQSTLYVRLCKWRDQLGSLQSGNPSSDGE